MGAVRRVYENPPIQEALCEIRFVSAGSWGLEAPAQLHSHFKDRYAGEPRQQVQTALEVAGGGGQNPTMSVQPSATRVVFSTDSGHRLITAGESLLSVHVLHPYEGWEAFEQRIAEAVDVYGKVTGVRPVRRIGMRYVNRIEIDSNSIDLADYFQLRTLTPSNMDLPVSDLFLRTSGVLDDAPTRVNLILASVEGTDRPTFILDIDVFREYADAGLQFEAHSAQISELREIERRAFEGSITDHLRRQFKEVTE